MKTIKSLMKYLKQFNWMIALSITLTVLEVICELMIPLLMSKIVDIGIPGKDLGYLAKIGLIMVGVAATAIFLGVLNAKYASTVSQGFAANLRKALYDKTQTFSFSNIDTFSSASLVTRMTSDVQTLQNSFMMSLRMLTRAPIMLLSAFIIAVSINRELSMTIIVSVILLVFGVMLIAKAAGKLFATMQKRLDALNGTVQENLVAIRVVKAFVREGHERLKFEKINDALTAAGTKAGGIVSIVMPMMMLVLNGTTLVAIWLGGQFVGNGVMTTGELMSFISYIMQILMSVIMFSMIFIMLTRAKACADRAVEVLDADPDIHDNPTQNSANDSPVVQKGKIEFDHVSFRYAQTNEEELTLSDISFCIEPGEFVGIIGGTGSGKTSLVNLIPRFYDVTEGAVRIDGVDVREYSQHNLRDGIGMVMQKNNLFTGTIRDNLLWGDESADKAKVEQAAKDAQAHDFIQSFPEGYDTVLGQGGVNVSGGQKQRICIARAMMKNPPILVFDDSTSAVDTATEARIRHSFHENFKDSTVLIVAQRISSVQDADKIIVLDDGAISGIGTHEELLISNEVYLEICNSQLEGGVA